MDSINRICRGVHESAAGQRMLLFALLTGIVALSPLAACVTPPTPPGQEIQQATEPPAAPSPFVCEESGEALVCRAEQEGVTVVVPWQGKKVQVENLPPGTLEELQSAEDEFKPHRLVINFEVLDAETYEIIYEFNPPIELRVAYMADDVAQAGGLLENLVLGFWNGEHWVAFTWDKHAFVLEGDSSGGIGIVKIPSWGDKPIAWGSP